MGELVRTDGGAGQGLALRPRRDGWSDEKRAAFVAALSANGNVRDACRAVGMSSTSAYRARAKLASFAADWDAALERVPRRPTIRAVPRALQRLVAGNEHSLSYRPLTPAGRPC